VRKIGWIRDLRVALKAVREANMTELFGSTSGVLELLVRQSASRNLEKGKSEEMARGSRENESRREMTDERNCCWHV
jgi:hypothetical protein